MKPKLLQTCRLGRGVHIPNLKKIASAISEIQAAKVWVFFFVFFFYFFEALDGSVIRAAALRSSGSAGPSGLDAYGWRRLCSSFKSASAELCCSIAILARHLCTSFVDPEIVLPLVSCRLIALDKNPGVRPIGVGEVVRRIIAKAVLSIIGPDIQRVYNSGSITYKRVITTSTIT